ncbi:hypothetical protein [Pandoraea sp. PE-S2T-3]|uniref:hypothetical protein n=2 Tax=unclassified Pandoraea TaxID=2624094 RepID=UPI001124D23D|nr:hypothetical protein [Pandoraea sp. PE-S2T-3]
MASRPLSEAAQTMPSINFVHRGCTVDIQIGERATLWDITIEVTPFDGVELIEPFGPRKLKLPKTEALDDITNTLVDEVCLAIDQRLVGC